MNNATILRKRMIIDPEVMDLLNKQIAMEYRASAVYLAIGSWFDQRELLNSKKFFYAQAEEERGHAMKIFKFINDNGGAAISPEILNIPNSFEGVRENYELALEMEIEVTKSIYKIFKTARAKEDFLSEAFLQWFVTEQGEEEQTFRDTLDLIDLMGEMPLKMIDERLHTNQ